MMTILSGKCRLTDHSIGTLTELEAGDSYFVGDGSRVTWDVIEEITKVFFGHKADGF